MDSREKQLLDLKQFTHEIDNEVTMILQSLQWDRNHLMEGTAKETCRFNSNHKFSPDIKNIHEHQCFLRCQGYTKEDKLLPDPPDINANTLVTLTNYEIMNIIDNAAKTDSSFRKGSCQNGPGPLTLERLQATYTGDERRAIHDAVVNAVPSCHNLIDLALSSVNGDPKQKSKSRVEILGELRDMKRRRIKYRVACNSTNFSHVLRDVIATQMEMYTDVKKCKEAEKNVLTSNNEVNNTTERNDSRDDNKRRERSRDTAHTQCDKEHSNKYKSGHREDKYRRHNEHKDKYQNLDNHIYNEYKNKSRNDIDVSSRAGREKSYIKDRSYDRRADHVVTRDSSTDRRKRNERITRHRGYHKEEDKSKRYYDLHNTKDKNKHKKY